MSADFEVDVPQGTARLTIELFDRFAGHVRTLADESNPAPGKRTFTWDLRDDQGEPVPLRQYMVRVSCDDISESRLVFL